MNQDQAQAQQIYALLKQIVAADGQTSSAELAWLDLLRQEMDLSAKETETFEVSDLKKLLQKEEEIEELVKLLLLVSLADGQTTPKEWKIIQEVSHNLGMNAERLEELRSQTFLSVDP